jgi:hypothetical protein
MSLIFQTLILLRLRQPSDFNPVNTSYRLGDCHSHACSCVLGHPAIRGRRKSIPMDTTGEQQAEDKHGLSTQGTTKDCQGAGTPALQQCMHKNQIA